MHKKSTYNPAIHNCKSIRLKRYDYLQVGLYFITICCQDRICRFGHIDNGIMILNEFGTIAFNEWRKLIKRFPNIQLHVFQIIPNHIHGIIEIVGAGFTPAPIVTVLPLIPMKLMLGQPRGVVPTVVPTVGAIVGAYKSLVANDCLNICKSENKIIGNFGNAIIMNALFGMKNHT